ncbi:MAG: hypothetical protein ACK5EK_00425 [Flavobacteriia bacterium]
MTEEKLVKVFQALRTEAPATSPLEIETWISQDFVIEVDRSMIYRRIFFSVLIGVGLITGFYLFSGNDEPKKVLVKSEEPVAKKTVELPAKEDHQQEKIIAWDQRKGGASEPYPINDGVIQSTPIYPNQETPFPTLLPKNAQPIHYSSKESTAGSGKQQLRDVLIILDSMQTYRKPPRVVMDEKDCYVQIYGDYAVLSYRIRNVNYYWGGRIHNEEIVEIDREQFNVFAFQSDNNAAVTNFGGRVFFGYRIDPETDHVEVIKFSQPWAPDKVFTSHMATPKERQNLVERSNSQKNFK